MTDAPPPPPPPPPPPRPGSYAPPPPPPPGTYIPYQAPAQYASFGNRLVALLIDDFIIVFPPLLLGGILILIGASTADCTKSLDAEGFTRFDCPARPGSVALIILGVAVAFFGYVLLAYLLWIRRIGLGQQTIGQRTMKVRVVDIQTGGAIGIGRATLRYLFRIFISGMFCDLGYLWMLWDDRSQTWHDKVADSVVITAA